MNIRTAKKGTALPNVLTEPLVEEKAEQQAKEKPAPQNVVPLTDDDFEGNAIIEEYMHFVNDHGITKEDIFQLLDSIMTTGYLEWDTSINNGKTPLRFRMRPVWAEDIISRHIDELSADKNLSMARFSNVLRALNLAASMTLFGDRTFDVHDEESFDEALEFIRSLPYPIFSTVTTQLAIFDRAIAIAMSDWALKNFTKPQKENS